MTVSRLFWCTKVVGAQEVPEQKNQKRNRSRNGQKRIDFMKFFEKIEALDPNINILISKYAPECEKYRKIGPKLFIYFS